MEYITAPIPAEGSIVTIEGYEFIVTDLHLYPVENSAKVKQCIYRGICTDNPCNDPIRHTGYNGGNYGHYVKVINL